MTFGNNNIKVICTLGEQFPYSGGYKNLIKLVYERMRTVSINQYICLDTYPSRCFGERRQETINREELGWKAGKAISDIPRQLPNATLDLCHHITFTLRACVFPWPF